MIRNVLLASVIIVFGVGLVCADSVTGTVKSIDKDKRTVTVLADKVVDKAKKETEKKELTFTVGADVKLTFKGVTKREGNNFNSLQPNWVIKMETQTVGSKEVVVGIDVLESPRAPKKKGDKK